MIEIGTKFAKDLERDILQRRSLEDRRRVCVAHVTFKGMGEKLYPLSGVCSRVGIRYKKVECEELISHHDFTQIIQGLCADDDISGIYIETDAPEQINMNDVWLMIPAIKDLNGCSMGEAWNLRNGERSAGDPIASTICYMLAEGLGSLRYKHCVVLGCGYFADTMVQHLRYGGAVVTVYDEYDRGIWRVGELKEADIIIGAMDTNPEAITSKMIGKRCTLVTARIIEKKDGNGYSNFAFGAYRKAEYSLRYTDIMEAAACFIAANAMIRREVCENNG